MEEVAVVIVGAGPAGIATSACLNRLSIPNIVLEKDDCNAPVWRKRTYDRLKLHLGKEFCNLPYMPFPSDAPTFVPRVGFLRYLDHYVAHFRVEIRVNRLVESAYFNEDDGKWRISVKETSSKATELYVCSFLVVAGGENGEVSIPKLKGLEDFEGQYIHSSQYLNGRDLYNKNVLVVGAGNSGMEIAFDLTEWGANTSIVVRSPVHIMTKEMVYLGMHLLKHMKMENVDKLMVLLCKLKYGNMSKFGIRRPTEGPFFLKATTGRSPTIDVGSMRRIKKGKIKVFPGISCICEDKTVEFEDGRELQFDVIIFATGYKSTVLDWLKDDGNLFNEDGMPERSFPDHWRGNNGLYCAGFSSKGLMGISSDAKNIANDIYLAYHSSIKTSQVIHFLCYQD